MVLLIGIALLSWQKAKPCLKDRLRGRKRMQEVKGTRFYTALV